MSEVSVSLLQRAAVTGYIGYEGNSPQRPGSGKPGQPGAEHMGAAVRVGSGPSSATCLQVALVCFLCLLPGPQMGPRSACAAVMFAHERGRYRLHRGHDLQGKLASLAEGSRVMTCVQTQVNHFG